MLIGEVGLSGDGPLSLAFIEEIMQVSDKITGGWFYWDYDPNVNGDSNLNADIWGIIHNNGVEVAKAKVLERPYPQFISGSLPQYSWDAKEQIFSFEMMANSATNQTITNPWTEIYLPDYAWPQGWQLTVIQGEIEQQLDQESKLINIRALTEGKIQIKITSK